MVTISKSSIFTVIVAFGFLAWSSCLVYGSEKVEAIEYLKSLSIEELLETQVTSVSKRPESLFDAAAAITVITSEDISRTGARSIPDILRIVPGLQVGQLDSSRWEVGARGFSDYFENKLLVLIDGRSMYTPLYAGVYWNSLDTILEDIDRIEVIRGPGATIWGANAVNGVINIITKNSSETRGGFVSAIYGTHDQPTVSARYGGDLGKNSTYRMYAKGFKRDSFEGSNGMEAHDEWHSFRMGFRSDTDIGPSANLSMQVEAYKGEADLSSMLSGYLTPPFFRITEETEDFHGGHFLATYNHTLSDTSVLETTFYYDGYDRELVVAKEQRDTLDLELKHHYSKWKGHDIVWGAGVRWSRDETQGSYFTSFDPENEELTLWNAFVQDDISLIDNIFWITLGSKFEHNDFTGFEIQPSIRARLKTSDTQLFWAAVSRAVRTPSRSEAGIQINLSTFQVPTGLLSLVRLNGNSEFDSEELIAYELGYRWQAADTFSLDIATFYNDYDDLRGVSQVTPFFEYTPFPPHLVLPQQFINKYEGTSYGTEISANWQVAEYFKLIAAYSWMNLDLVRKDQLDSSPITEEKNFPRHQFHLRSYYDVTNRFSVNSELYWVDEYEAEGIDDYLRFDLVLRYQLSESLELCAGGENIFGSDHKEAEVQGSNIVSTEVPSQYWLKAIYSF